MLSRNPVGNRRGGRTAGPGGSRRLPQALPPAAGTIQDKATPTRRCHTYERGSVELEVTAMIAQDDQVVLAVDRGSSAHPRRPTLRERLHRRVHRSGWRDHGRSRVHGHAVRERHVRGRGSLERNHRHEECNHAYLWSSPAPVGVIGIRLLPLLVSAGHVTAGMTRSPGKSSPPQALAPSRSCDPLAANRAAGTTGSAQSGGRFSGQAAPGIVELVEAPVDTGRISAVPETREVAHAD